MRLVCGVVEAMVVRYLNRKCSKNLGECQESLRGKRAGSRTHLCHTLVPLYEYSLYSYGTPTHLQNVSVISSTRHNSASMWNE